MQNDENEEIRALVERKNKMLTDRNESNDEKEKIPKTILELPSSTIRSFKERTKKGIQQVQCEGYFLTNKLDIFSKINF